MRKQYLILLSTLFILEGCATKFGSVAVATTLGGGVGAGLGYTVVHNGSHQQYRTQNTIISASILAVLAGLATWYHLDSLDTQKVDLAGKFSRSTYLDRDVKNLGRLDPIGDLKLDKKSVRLDPETRWVLPEFSKRFLPSERTDTELVAPHQSWEITRPGFFVNKDEDPSLFKEEERK